MPEPEGQIQAVSGLRASRTPLYEVSAYGCLASKQGLVCRGALPALLVPLAKAKA